MLQKTAEADGSVILIAYLSFPNECEFVVMKMLDGGAGIVKFSHISRIFGPQVSTLWDIFIKFIITSMCASFRKRNFLSCEYA